MESCLTAQRNTIMHHKRMRSLRTYTGEQRPSFAEEPDAGQESVWDYPRPPRLGPAAREIVIRVEDVEVVRGVLWRLGDP